MKNNIIDLSKLMNNLKTYRDRDLPFDFSDALLALLLRSRFEALLPLRLESRSRLRDLDFSEYRERERDFFSAGDFERLPRDFERLRDERRELDLK